MKTLSVFKVILVCHILLFQCLETDLSFADSGITGTHIPPVEQRLVRQGAFAVRLLESLGMGTGRDEQAAESILGKAGIAPRNGWIADYPITPDIVGELWKTLAAAAESGRVGLARDAALKRFKAIVGHFTLPVEHSSVAGNNEEGGPSPLPPSVQVMTEDYFAVVGPPVVTYYEPPSEYSHLYCLVPYPFRSHGLRFSGFHILKEFHRTIFVNGRVEFVTNIFHVFRGHRVFMIDPLARFNGKTYAGIGVSSEKGFLETGIPGSERKLFNGPQPWLRPGDGKGAGDISANIEGKGGRGE